MADEEQVQDTTEELSQVEEETTDTEENESSEEGEQDGSDDALAKANKVAQDQKKRAEKAEAELKKLKGLGKESGRAPNTDDHDLSDQEQRIGRSEERAERAALRSMGVTHPEDIKYVRDAAKRLGIDVEEAAVDEFIVNKLQRMQSLRKTKDATPDPTRRGGLARNTKLPDFSKMTNAEFDEWEKKNR